MRLTAVFLIAAIMQVSASSYGQKITLSKKNASLISIFKEIRTQSGYDFLFDREVIEKVGAVNINVSNATLDEVLKSCLTSQPLTYSIEDKTVVIKEKAFLEKLSSLFVQDLIVNGVVNDENGMPLPGVSVMLKGTNIVRVTNARGTFALQAPNANSILVLSYLGYKTKEVAVAEKVSVNMELDPGKLDEVLVIGYGTTTRRFNTGSQSGISAKDLEKQPVTNVLQALQGRLAGVTLTQTNGLPGAGINVQIRGANGIGLLGVKPNRPLYIIDGVPYLAESINTATNVLSSRSNLVLPSAEGNTSPMNSINPADIENIEVLKDADATAIYGSRGGNGVILITTKKGKAGKTKFSVNASTGASNVTHFVETVGTEQYLALRRKAFANNTVAGQPTAANAPDLVSWDQNGYTDFQRLMLGNTAKTNDVNANLSGGDAQTNFYIGGNYHKEGNVYPGGQGYERGGGRFNLNHASFNQRFNLSLSAMYSTDKNNISTTDLATYAYSLPPNFPLYRADGGLNWDGFINNPMGYLLQTNDNRTSNLLTNLTLKYTLLKGLDIKSNVGYGKSDMNQVVIRPLASLSTNSNPTSGTAAFVYNYTNNYIVEPQVTYNTKIGKGTLNTLAGGSYQFKQSKMPYYTSASGYTSDDLLRTVAAATIVSTTSNSVDYKYASLFGRLNYNYDGKYIFNANFRRDGSSRFGPANKFGNFGSVGAAWIFSEEQFLKDRFSWFSFGKLRSSYGIVGSDEIDNYGYLDTYTNSTYVFAGSTGLNPTRLANPDFQWEETKKLDIGLELGFLKDRLSFTANYYRNRTGNQLLNATISAQAGLPGPQTNLPATVQNSGWEFTVNTTNIQKKDFKWTSSFNISQNKNKLLSFDNIEKSAYLTTYIVGNPISSYYLYEYKGIDPLTNLPSLTDFNNSGSISGGFAATGRGDRYYAGTSYPKFFGGLTNALTYKGVTLDFTFQFVKQKGISLLSSSFYPPGYFSNAALSVVNDYLALGSQDYLVSAGTRGPAGNASFIAYSDYTGSDASLVDASFIRMKNVNLSYVLPTKWLSKIDAQTIRIYVQAQNLFTITNYEGFDPESQGVATPPLRTITAGLQLTF